MTRRHFHLLIKTIAFLIAFNAHGQSRYYLKSRNVNPVLDRINGRVDSTEINRQINKFIQDLRAQYYLLANLDNHIIKADTIFVDIFLGRKYDQLYLVKNESFVSLNKKSNKRTAAGLYSHSQFEKIKTETIDELNASGYPFARIGLDSIKFQEGIVHGVLNVDKGLYITFDSLEYARDLINYQFLTTLLKINYDEPYSQKLVNGIEERIRSLSYLENVRPPEVSFQLGKGSVELFLKEKKVNNFDGILGFIPAQNNQTQLTGEIRLGLKNLFKSGKSLDFNWIKLKARSQFLDAKYVHPMVLNSPLNASIGFYQLKEDTLFSNRSLTFDIDYNMSPQVKFNLKYENADGNKLDNNDADKADFVINYYGIGMQVNKLDNQINATEGWNLNANVLIGGKETKSALNRPSTRSNQYKVSLDAQLFLPLVENRILYTGFKMGLVHNESDLFLNDLFRLGGLRTIRGFNENVFFASQFISSNVEFRFLFETNSYFFLFFDQAFLRYRINAGELSDQPSGLGAGFKLETRGGYFNLVYGLGRQSGQGFSFDNSKIHFGYTANF